MRHLIFVLALSVSIGGFVFVNKADAFLSLGRPFGGRITTITIPGVICAGGTGIITITPAGKSPSMSYVTTGTKKPKVGGWILGLYNPSAPICETDSTPPAPYSAQSVHIYGVSGMFGI